MSARAIFARAMTGLLAALGEQAFLRGEACTVNVERGVQVTEDDGAVVVRDVATMSSSMNPKRGDLLAHPEGNYRLDRLLANSGHLVRYVATPYSGAMPPVIAPHPYPAPPPWSPPPRGTFVFPQTEPSLEWVIPHNTNRYPSVTVVDTDGNVVDAAVAYTDANTVIVTFVAPFNGVAYLN